MVPLDSLMVPLDGLMVPSWDFALNLTVFVLLPLWYFTVNAWSRCVSMLAMVEISTASCKCS